ncbi:hypothetical protein Tco_1177601 [Tanacetum coccineum]
MVAFLEKPTKSDGFKEIFDFLNAHPIKYALTVNPIVYTLCIQQFWATAKAKTINGEEQLQALEDRKKVIITESTIRSVLRLEDVEGTECLPNATIFEELTRMGMQIVYTLCIQQFWATAKAKTINGEEQLQALGDRKKVIITESTIRSDLRLEDVEGTECLPNATIFEELTRMGYEKLSQKLTFYKAFFSLQ